MILHYICGIFELPRVERILKDGLQELPSVQNLSKGKQWELDESITGVI